MPKTKQCAHWLLSIGEYKYVKDLAADQKIIVDNTNEINGIIFRILRKQGSINPYSKVIGYDKQKAQIIREQAKINGIKLHGGLGDHIEDMAKIIEWSQKVKIKPKLYTTKTRIMQLERLTEDVIWEQARSENNNVAINSFLASLEEGITMPTSFLRKNIHTERGAKNQILCCWGAQGYGDKLSGWLRSIDSKAVNMFYSKIIEAGYNPNNIIDITNWKEWEAKRFANMGIRMINPAKGDVYDLGLIAKESAIIISIDTLLIHLSAAMGKDVITLLPIFEDERWTNHLSRQTSYKKHCQILKQKEYGKWDNEINTLFKRLIASAT